MFYIVESSKSFAEVIFDLEPVVQRLGFVVLQMQDLAELLLQREIDFDEDCQVFDLCNYRFMEKLLQCDKRLSLLQPWRISVFTENGATKIGLIRPQALAGAFKTSPVLTRTLAEMEEKLIQIVDETR